MDTCIICVQVQVTGAFTQTVQTIVRLLHGEEIGIVGKVRSYVDREARRVEMSCGEPSMTSGPPEQKGIIQGGGKQ